VQNLNPINGLLAYKLLGKGLTEDFFKKYQNNYSKSTTVVHGAKE
jgi:hypothetical protein